jgi:plastocyanin
MSTPMFRTFGVLSAVAAAASIAAADVFEVTLNTMNFSYGGKFNEDIELVIKPGDTVRWVWALGQHSVVSGNPGAPDAGELFNSGPPVLPPKTFEFTFTDPGVYEYFCAVHFGFGMTSFLTVEDAACFADCNLDGSVNIFDFLCFQGKVTTGDPAADCNGDGSVNIFDFLCFQGQVTQGC